VKLPQLAASFISNSAFNVAFWPILLKNDFWPWSKEQFFEIESQWGILIQKSGASDSIIAHFSAQLARLRLLQHNRPFASFRCAAEFSRYRGIADSDKPSARQI
jgi:hypothetical protein